MALSIITTTFTEGAERTRALGIWAAIAGGGGSVGLILGGFIVDSFSWPWIFAINVPVGIATIFAAVRFVPESREEAHGRDVDVLGALLVTAGLVLLTFAIVKAADYGWGSGRTLGLGGAALVLLAAFVAFEGRSKAPLVRLSIFRVRTLTAANVSLLFVVGALFSLFFFGALYLQQIKGFNALESGLGFLPQTAGIVVGSILSQQLIARFGVKPVLVAGLAVATLGLLWLTRLTPHSSYWTGVLPGFVLLALGTGNAFVPLTLVATTGLKPQDQGLASGIFNTAQQVGGALGLAILSSVATSATGASRTANELVHGYTTAFAAGVGLMAIGVVCVIVLLRSSDVADIDASPEAMLAAAG